MKTEPKMVLVLGAGRMGAVHIRALREASEKLYPLRIVAVDRDAEKLKALPADVQGFSTIAEAVAAAKPDIAVMAFNDDQHSAAFKELFRLAPGVRAVFSEKPLTEALAQAKELAPELSKRFLSLNTVINFSPVFDSVREKIAHYGGLTPMGFEGVWGKDRTADTRPSLGVPSESVHALSVIADMFGQAGLVLESGQGKQGRLSGKAQDVIYDMEARFVSPKTGLAMNFHTSYVLESQQRRVTAYCRAAQGKAIAFEMTFDLPSGDALKVYEIDSATGKARLLADEAPRPIDNGGMTGDKVTAFIKQSVEAFALGAAPSPALSTLARALEIQEMVEQIKPGHAALKIVRADADPSRLRRAEYPPLAEASDAERLARLSSLASHPKQQTASPYSDNAAPAPKRGRSGPGQGRAGRPAP